MIVDQHGNPLRAAPAGRKLSAQPQNRDATYRTGVRGTPRDRPIGYTTAPTPARQIWELHRIREESRQQSLISPHFVAFLGWAKCVVVGSDPFGLRFPSMPKEERDRLRDPARDLRDRWREYQDTEIGMRGETLGELCGQTQDAMLVDGDAFIVPQRDGNAAWRYMWYPGDSLAETSRIPGTLDARGEPQRALGIEIDEWGRPIRYWFGARARYRNLGYTSWSTDVDAMPLPAAMVWHIRDRRRNGADLRGWPRIVGAYEYISRLNEFDQAFIRGAIRRVAASIALKRDMGATYGDVDRDIDSDFRDLPEQRITGAGPYTDESVKPYQESEAAAGGILELEPGYEATTITTGAPSPQEADVVGKFENRIAAALGVSIMTLTGDYSGTSFSGGQLGLMGDRRTADDLQYIQRRQVVARVYARWLGGVWTDLLMRWPMLRPDDRRIFEYARHSLPRMPVLEKGKILAAATGAVSAGIMGLVEARAEAGYSTDDVEAYLEEWREQRDMLGETAAGGESAPPMDGEPEDDEGEDDGPEDEDDMGEDDDAE